MAITLAGVLWVVLEQRDGDEHPHVPQAIALRAFSGRRGDRGPGVRHGAGERRRRRLRPGRIGLDSNPGRAGRLFPLITVLRRWRPMVAAARQGKPMLMLLGGALVGPFVGVSMFMLALQNCHEGVVATILATIPVMILPFSVYLFGERVSLRAIGGALVAVAGVALLMLPVYSRPRQTTQMSLRCSAPPMNCRTSATSPSPISACAARGSRRPRADPLVTEAARGGRRLPRAVGVQDQSPAAGEHETGLGVVGIVGDSQGQSGLVAAGLADRAVRAAEQRLLVAGVDQGHLAGHGDESAATSLMK